MATLMGVLLLSAGVPALANVNVTVQDAAGQPVSDAAVYAEPLEGTPPQRAGATAEVQQKGRKFVPTVTVVRVGTTVSFPNNDRVKHNVYSFSPAKVFDLKLFSGESTPLVFDKAGTVAVGCNIHDQMAAYIHVVATPYFGKTDSVGSVNLGNLPPGSYRLKAWHYRLAPGTGIPEQAMRVGTGDVQAQITLPLKAGAAAE